MNDRTCVLCIFLLPTDREKRATVSDAAVMWAGKQKEKERKWEREVAKGCAER